MRIIIKIIMLSLTLIAVLFASISHAALINMSSNQASSTKARFAKNLIDNDPTVLTASIITPNNKELLLDKLSVFLGTSMTSPCSDLIDVNDFYTKYEPGNPLPYSWVSVDPIVSGAGTSDILIQEINFLSHHEGEPPVLTAKYTCMRFDAIVKGVKYSTGNVYLYSENDKYVAANPSVITVDFTK